MSKKTQDFCVKLVEAVEKYPCLYNYKIPEYSRSEITDKAWAEVATECNETGIYIHLFIHNERTGFLSLIHQNKHKHKIY